MSGSDSVTFEFTLTGTVHATDLGEADKVIGNAADELSARVEVGGWSTSTASSPPSPVGGELDPRKLAEAALGAREAGTSDSSTPDEAPNSEVPPGGVQDTPAREEWQVYSHGTRGETYEVATYASEAEARARLDSCNVWKQDWIDAGNDSWQQLSFAVRRRTVTEWAPAPASGEET